MNDNTLTYTKADAQRDRLASKETLKIYWACLKPSWKYLLLSLFLTALDAVFELLIPFLAGRLISDGIGRLGDTGIAQPNFQYVWLYGGLIIALGLFAILAQGLAMNINAKISSDFIERLRNTLFWKAEQFSFSNIGRFPVSMMTTMLSNDCNNIRFFVLMLTRAGFKSPLMILISFCFIFALSWMIGLITVPLSIAAFVAIAIIIRKTRPFFIETQTAIDRVNNNVEEDTEGIREVKAFCRESHMDEEFSKANQQLTDVSLKAFSRMAVVMAITQFAINVTIGIIQYFGGWNWLMTASGQGSIWFLFNNGRPFDAGELSMLSNFTAAMTMGFSFLSLLLQFLGRAEASKERIDRVLVEPIDISYSPKEKTEGFDPDSLRDGSISLKGACLTYVGDLSKLALRPIDLDIPTGKVIGIVGGTGSGKSSLVSLIPRLYDASSGEVFIGGHDVKDYSVQALRNDIGVVLQQNVLFTGTIRSNILWGKADATDEEIWEALEIAQANGFVKSFPEGLETPVAQGGKSVSGGQKQRLCIARAIIKKPKILILDDSTSACDMETERRIKEGLFTKMKGTTILIIAQRISSVKDADEILVLDDGKEVGRGTHASLLETCPIYREIDAIQKKGVGD